MLKVVEIFKTLCGEGIVIGCPSLFVRLSGCSLRCCWCDSAYAWSDRKEISAEKILEMVQEIGKNIKLVTITGGEPLLQGKELIELCRLLKGKGYKVLVETNGTIAPSRMLKLNVDTFSVSPKLSNSGQKVEYGMLDWASYLKFVICNPKRDIEEVEQFIGVHMLKPDLKRMLKEGKIILQPNGLDKDPNQLLRQIAEYVREYSLPYRVLPQLHRQIWGLRRGV